MDENNKALEDAAQALDAAAENSDAPVAETPVEAPVEPVKTEDAPAETPATETPAETPVEELAAEPAPVAPAATVIEAPATPAPVAPAVKVEGEKKKSKKGLIIGCSVGAAVVLGLGGLGVAYAIDNQSDNIALSAIADLLSSKQRTVDGYIEYAVNEESDDDRYYLDKTNCSGGAIDCITAPQKTITKVRVEINSKVDNGNNADTKVTFTATYGEKDFQLTLGSVVMKDYTLYVSIDNLKQTIKDVLAEAASTEYADYAELYNDLIDKVAGEVDGVWWKIYVPDVVDAIDEISSSEKKKIKETYQCFVDAADRAIAKQNSYVDIYKDNAFVELAEYKGSNKFDTEGTPYTLKLNAKKLADYSNAMVKEAKDLELEDCISKVSPSSYKGEETEIKEVSAEDIEEVVKELPEIIITVKNGFFSHTVTGLNIDVSEQDFTGKASFKIGKEVNAVTAPSDAKNITELYTNVKKAYEEWEETATCKVLKAQYPTYYNVMCDPRTNKPKPEYESQLKGADLLV
ncbi:hypothetical protein J6X90_03135 [Candidatus Saccharibacteria bacterium]|nr:hypothetical protein [Candidatus Saccharibacteria bacterium]